MDLMQLKDVVHLFDKSKSPLPHYRYGPLHNLLLLADHWSTEFGPHVNRLLKGLPETNVLVDQGTPLVSSSDVVGQVSWMEDFTMFAIHPDRDWDVDLPRAVKASEYDLTINNALGYTGPNAAESAMALLYDPAGPALGSKQRYDIRRAQKAIGPVEVKVRLPEFDQLRAGVKRWDRHAMAGDYFLWQWLWVAAAGISMEVKGDGFTAWLGFVEYGDTRIFTAYQAEGDSNSIGTGCLSYALAGFDPMKTILTVPMQAEQAKHHNVDSYETYKRRFANAQIPVHYLSGRYRAEEKPYPPYYNAQLQEMVNE